MKVIEKSSTRLVIGGWRVGTVVAAVGMTALPVAFFFLLVREQPSAIWANLFILLVVGLLVPSMTFWQRIVFDAEAGEVLFDQLRPRGRVRRTARLTPVSKVEVEATSGSSGSRSSRRLVLVTGHERTPFTELYSKGRFEAEQKKVNDWLREVFGDRWRDSAAALRAAPRDTRDDEAPEGVRRVRHPASGLTVDLPSDWSASVSTVERGPLKVFGITLLPRVERPGPQRAPEEGGDWNTLVAVGAEDAGLKLTVHDGPLTETLQDALEGPWSKQWGTEVLQTTPEVAVGGMRGFSVARRIPAGGSTLVFGEVSGDVATRQVWLGADDLHVEAVGMARLDDADIQHALDAMFDSIRLPRDG